MDTLEATRLLATLDLPTRTVTPIAGGWASWTFDVAGEYILRVARDREISAAHRREERLLPELADAVDFEVPRPAMAGDHAGHRFMVYRKLVGRPWSRDDPPAPVAHILRALHTFPAERAASLLSVEQTWREVYEARREWIDGLVLPRLPTGLRDRVVREYDRMMPELDDVEPALVHADLGVEHILCRPDGTATGLIDFETATVGDAAIDFVGLLAVAGEERTRSITAAYGSAVDRSRLRFYRWMSAVHAIHHAVVTENERILADGIADLAKSIENADVRGGRLLRLLLLVGHRNDQHGAPRLSDALFGDRSQQRVPEPAVAVAAQDQHV